MAEHAATTHDAGRLQSVARDLWDSATDARPTDPPSRTLGADLDAAYQVQDLLTLRSLWAGAAVRGHKVTSLEGLPCFGVLFDAMHHEGNGPLVIGDLVAPRIQAGIGFVVREDLTGREVDQQSVPDVVSATVPVLEVVDSRLTSSAPAAALPLAQVDLVADNAGVARFVTGPESPVPGPDHAWHAQLLRHDRVVEDGGGIVRPWRAFAWLTRSLRERGLPLRAGELVVVGGLTASQPLTDGSWTAQVTGVGEAGVTVDAAATPWRHAHPSTRSSA